MDPTINQNKSEEVMSDKTQVALHHTGPVSAKGMKASLVVLAGADLGAEYPLDAFPLSIGRAPQAGVFVNAPSVSRKHAQIDLVTEDAGAYYTITDLGSSNGTQVNGVKVVTTALRNGDRIRLGEVILKFLLQDEVDSTFHKRIHQLIHYDQLTGLLTLEAFRRRLDAAFAAASANRPFALAMTDLDGLKRINDTHGHLAGSRIIQEMGRIMRETIRAKDIAGIYGGDEGIILFPASRIEEAAEVAEALRAAIARAAIEYEGHALHVTISQGLAECPRHGTTPEELIAAADKALYQAKAAGRNAVRLAPAAE